MASLNLGIPSLLFLLLFVFLCSLQVLSGFCKTNAPEGSSELVQLQPQKGSFQCSSITWMSASKKNSTPQTLSVEPYLAWGLLSFPVFFSSLLSQGTPGSKSYSPFKRLKHNLWLTSQGSFSRPALPFAIIAMFTKWEMQKWRKKNLLNPLHPCAYVCSM